MIRYCITKSDRQAIKAEIRRLKKLLNCKHKETISKSEYNAYPYGEDCTWDECTNCGTKLNFKIK